MTKLIEWLTVLATFVAVWATLVFGYVQSPLIDKYINLVMISPLILVTMFGLYALFIVLYRVYTFNDCEEAAKELQAEIEEAKEYFKSKGLIIG